MASAAAVIPVPHFYIVQWKESVEKSLREDLEGRTEHDLNPVIDVQKLREPRYLAHFKNLIEEIILIKDRTQKQQKKTTSWPQCLKEYNAHSDYYQGLATPAEARAIDVKAIHVIVTRNIFGLAKQAIAKDGILEGKLILTGDGTLISKAADHMWWLWAKIRKEMVPKRYMKCIPFLVWIYPEFSQEEVQTKLREGGPKSNITALPVANTRPREESFGQQRRDNPLAVSEAAARRNQQRVEDQTSLVSRARTVLNVIGNLPDCQYQSQDLVYTSNSSVAIEDRVFRKPLTLPVDEWRRSVGDLFEDEDEKVRLLAQYDRIGETFDPLQSPKRGNMSMASVQTTWCNGYDTATTNSILGSLSIDDYTLPDGYVDYWYTRKARAFWYHAMERKKRCYMQLDAGTGKTSIALGAEILRHINRTQSSVSKPLILVAQSQMVADQYIRTGLEMYSKIRFIVVGTEAQSYWDTVVRVKATNDVGNEITAHRREAGDPLVIIVYPTYSLFRTRQKDIDYDYDALILDDPHIALKNKDNKAFEAVRKAIRPGVRVGLLSGTPLYNSFANYRSALELMENEDIKAKEADLAADTNPYTNDRYHEYCILSSMFHWIENADVTQQSRALKIWSAQHSEDWMQLSYDSKDDNGVSIADTLPIKQRFSLETAYTGAEREEYQTALKQQLKKLMIQDEETGKWSFVLGELETTKSLGLFVHAADLRHCSARLLHAMYTEQWTLAMFNSFLSSPKYEIERARLADLGKGKKVNLPRVLTRKLKEDGKQMADSGQNPLERWMGPKLRLILSLAQDHILARENWLLCTSNDKEQFLLHLIFDHLNLQHRTFHSGVPNMHRVDLTRSFQNDRSTIFLANLRMSIEGVSLHKSCRSVVITDLPYGPGSYEQLENRVYRVGQGRTTCCAALRASMGDGDEDLLDFSKWITPNYLDKSLPLSISALSDPVKRSTIVEDLKRRSDEGELAAARDRLLQHCKMLDEYGLNNIEEIAREYHAYTYKRVNVELKVAIRDMAQAVE
ncbi:hypothetical protein MMC18_005959 [Xylographa bjoerkii]|nr:hypothetical protein [Xylographa bjoerkii]